MCDNTILLLWLMDLLSIDLWWPVVHTAGYQPSFFAFCFCLVHTFDLWIELYVPVADLLYCRDVLHSYFPLFELNPNKACLFSPFTVLHLYPINF